MTNDPDRNELLEIYKLHAELADRVSQRREGANRLYVSLLAGLAAFLAVLIRFGVGDVPVQVVLVSVGVVGTALSASWYVVLRSYRQLNTASFGRCTNWRASWLTHFSSASGTYWAKERTETVTGG